MNISWVIITVAKVDVDSSCQFPADSQPMSIGLVWVLVATRRSIYIHQVNRVNSHNDYGHDDSIVMVTHTHTRLTALFPGLPGSASTRKVTPIWILLKQETVSGSGISWAICKSASRSRQITMPVSHHSSFLQAGCPSCWPTNSVKALKESLWWLLLLLLKHYTNIHFNLFLPASQFLLNQTCFPALL